MRNGTAIIHTWGTNSQSNYGVVNFVNAQYRGENVGHASIELKLPINPENTELVNKYCRTKPEIPYIIKNENNEQVYVIRFSFIPGSDETPFYLNPTYKEDCIYERAGHHTTDRHILETSDLVPRRGNTREIRVFPACSLTAMGRALDFDTYEGLYILNQKNIANCMDSLTTVDLLKKKIEDLKNQTEPVNLSASKHKTISFAAKILNLKLPPENTSVKELERLLSDSYIEQLQKDLLDNLIQKKNILTKLIGNDNEAALYSKKMEETVRIRTELAQLANFERFSEWYKDKEVSIIEIKEIIKTLYPCAPEEIFENFKSNLDKELRKLAACYTQKIIELKKELTTLQQNEDKYLCYGRPADGYIELPMGTGKAFLRVANMLEQMRVIIDSGREYNLNTHNCSTTVMSILEAGKNGKLPTYMLPVATPQIVYNSAMQFRDKELFGISASKALKNLDQFYQDKCKILPTLNVQSRKYINNLNDTILYFVTDNLFPDNPDDPTFYIFSEEAKKAILINADKPLSTPLLRDLWGLIPEQKLPLSDINVNGAEHNSNMPIYVKVDHNMTIRQLIHGLTLLAKNNAEKRIQNIIIKNPPHKESFKNDNKITQAQQGSFFKKLSTPIMEAITKIFINPSKSSLNFGAGANISTTGTTYSSSIQALSKLGGASTCKTKPQETINGIDLDADEAIIQIPYENQVSHQKNVAEKEDDLFECVTAGSMDLGR